jgi:ABC-type phosphate transport system substrate-binding protein/ABC-type multidrug transport system fused ATPase/permease subunit
MRATAVGLAVATVATHSPAAIHSAGSSTVLPILQAWRGEWANSTDADLVQLEGGGSSSAAHRVCGLPDSACEQSPADCKVDIGAMSRDWKYGSEAELASGEEGYHIACAATASSAARYLTQLEVGTDGLAVVVAKGGGAHACVTQLGGLTLAQLRWMFSTASAAALQLDKVDVASVAPNDDGDGVLEWDDLSPLCAGAGPIEILGPGASSGTRDFFTSVLAFSDDEDLDPARYVSSEDDEWIVAEVLQRPTAITFLGYAYFAANTDTLEAVPIGADRRFGTADTKLALIAPSGPTITDGSYIVFTRKLYLNVDEEAWDRVEPYVGFGLSHRGQDLVAAVGYVSLNAALRAEMRARLGATFTVKTSCNTDVDWGVGVSGEPVCERPWWSRSDSPAALGTICGVAISFMIIFILIFENAFTTTLVTVPILRRFLHCKFRQPKKKSGTVAPVSPTWAASQKLRLGSAVEAATTIQFTSHVFTIQEGAEDNIRIGIFRTGDMTESVTFAVTVFGQGKKEFHEGASFEGAKNGRIEITFGPGQWIHFLTTVTEDNNVWEPEKWLLLDLEIVRGDAAIGRCARATVRILDDDSYPDNFTMKKKAGMNWDLVYAFVRERFKTRGKKFWYTILAFFTMSTHKVITMALVPKVVIDHFARAEKRSFTTLIFICCWLLLSLAAFRISERKQQIHRGRSSTRQFLRESLFRKYATLGEVAVSTINKDMWAQVALYDVEELAANMWYQVFKVFEATCNVTLGLLLILFLQSKYFQNFSASALGSSLATLVVIPASWFWIHKRERKFVADVLTRAENEESWVREFMMLPNSSALYRATSTNTEVLTMDARFRDIYKRFLKQHQEVRLYGQDTQFCSYWVSTVMLIAVVMVGGLMLVDHLDHSIGSMTVGTFAALYKVYSRVGKDIGSLNKAVATMVRASSGLRSMVALLNAPPDESRQVLNRNLAHAGISDQQVNADTPPPDAEKMPWKSIELIDCTFYTHTQRCVLQNCNAVIPGGKVYTLSGGHAEGKQVVSRLLSGNLMPDSGLLYIPPFWKGARVPRDIVLLTGGLRANLCVYQTAASWPELLELAKRCGIKEEVWEGKIRGRKEMINWADMDREDVLSKGLSGVMKVGRLTTNVLTRASTYELKKSPSSMSLPGLNEDEGTPAPASPTALPKQSEGKSTPPPSYSQHLILGILRAIATDPDVLVVVPDMHHLPPDAPIREVLMTWQKRGLAGVLHASADGGTRTLVMVEGAQEWRSEVQETFIPADATLRIADGKITVEDPSPEAAPAAPQANGSATPPPSSSDAGKPSPPATQPDLLRFRQAPLVARSSQNADVGQ